MKRSFTRIFTVLLLMVSLAFGVSAAEAPGKSCGDNLTWDLKDGVLMISGDGPMYDFPEGTPWEAQKDQIRKVTLLGTVTYVGENAFRDYDSLTDLDLGGSLREAGKSSFSSCDGLTAVSLPATFRIFGEESFSHCSSLKEFTFAGSMPSFRLNCLWDTQAKLIYPQNNPWPLEHIQQLEGAFQGRIEFLSSDGTDPYDPQPEEAPEEVKPEPAEAPTEKPTEAPTAPPTEAPTQPPVTLPPVVTEPVTEPVETRPEVPILPGSGQEIVELPEPEKPGMGLGTIILIAVMVLSGIGILVMAGVLLHSRTRLTQEDFPDPSMNIRPQKPQQSKPMTRAEQNASRMTRKTGNEKPAEHSGTGAGKPDSQNAPQKNAEEEKGGKYSR